MTEDEARAAVNARVGGAATERLEQLAALVIAENRHQNLIAPASETVIWNRHILDSVQLLALAPSSFIRWLDIGTGGGFPGLALAASHDAEFLLIEPRKRRALFLEKAASALSLRNVRVLATKIEQVTFRADVISARAVASLQDIFIAASHCATNDTVWILPRGRIDAKDLVALRREWKGMFHVEPSATDPNSMIVVADGVASR